MSARKWLLTSSYDFPSYGGNSSTLKYSAEVTRLVRYARAYTKHNYETISKVTGIGAGIVSQMATGKYRPEAGGPITQTKPKSWLRGEAIEARRQAKCNKAYNKGKA